MLEEQSVAGTIVVNRPDQLAHVRRTVGTAASAVLDDTVGADVSLAVSELVTNVLQHGDSPAIVRYGPCTDPTAVDATAFELTVESQTPDAPTRSPEPVPASHHSGRGLLIVTALADDITIDHVDGTATVTCQFVSR